VSVVCRNIKVLYNFEPPATDEEIHALLASLVTAAPPRNRDVELARARTRAAVRFGSKRRTRGAAG